MKFSINYKLTGAGWSECTVTAGDKTAHVTASYLSDALESLAGAVLAIGRGINLARASFDEEPGEYRWVFERVDDQDVRLRIFEFSELWSKKEDEDGILILDVQIPVLVLVRSMVSCLADVLQASGIEGYREKWLQHDFPLQQYEELRSTLAILKSHPTSG